MYLIKDGPGYMTNDNLEELELCPLCWKKTMNSFKKEPGKSYWQLSQ